MSEDSKTIVIVGGGLSGTCMAIALHQTCPNHQIILFEKNPEAPGRGIAYHTDFTHQPLNVPAAGMSLFPDQPDHFVQWLLKNRFRYKHLVPEVHAKTFVSRKVFGDYVTEELEKSMHGAGSRIQVRIDQVRKIEKSDERFIVGTESQVQITADVVILGLGNFAPADILSDDDSIYNDPKYLSNPWTDKVYSGLTGYENILLAGTGLSAVDVILGLRVRGFEGHITMCSRRGRLPLPHDLSHPPLVIEYPGDLSPKAWFLLVRQLIRNNRDQPWITVIEGLRPHTSRIWQSWSIEEKRYFLRKIRPFWEIARHRIPHESFQLVQELIQQGKLKIEVGTPRMISADSTEITVQICGEQEPYCTARFSKVINCTGPESNWRKIKSDLIQSLLDDGLITIDSTGLGISCESNGTVLDKDQQPVKGLICIGPMRKAQLWETTALREIREQAYQVASCLKD